MTGPALYRLLESGDPRALSLARSLTARVRSGIASPEEARTHAELVSLHRAASPSRDADLDDRTTARLRALVARARGAPSLTHDAFGRRGGGGGGGHHGGHHGGWRGGGWGRRGWSGGTWFPYAPYWSAPALPCYWTMYGWVCPPWWY